MKILHDPMIKNEYGRDEYMEDLKTKFLLDFCGEIEEFEGEYEPD